MSGQQAQREEHKSMIDDKVRMGAETSGKMANPEDALKTDDDASLAGSNQTDKQQQNNQQQNTPQQQQNNPQQQQQNNPQQQQNTPQQQQPQGQEQKPQGPHSTGYQPSGANVTGQNPADTNQNPHSNSDEPNQGGFGGGSSGAQPSVSAKPTDKGSWSKPESGADRSDPTQGGASSGNLDNQGDRGDKASTDFDNRTGASHTKSSATASGSKPGEGSAPGGSMGGAARDAGTSLPPSDSKNEGTGQKYEKSTGLSAEGGDFDASRPGAGREADRLLEEKGIQHGPDKSKPEPGAEGKEDQSKHKHGHGHDDHAKKGLGEKIKEKLTPHH